jgi:hypothetical protein
LRRAGNTRALRRARGGRIVLTGREPAQAAPLGMQSGMRLKLAGQAVREIDLIVVVLGGVSIRTHFKPYRA